MYFNYLYFNYFTTLIIHRNDTTVWARAKFRGPNDISANVIVSTHKVHVFHGVV